MVGQAVSHYRILRRLGAGGMGVVYLAADTVLGRQVAIKFPTEGSGGVGESARLLSEARKASRLQHPKIAQIHEFGETAAGRPFIVMEYVDGQPLRDIVRANPAPERAGRLIGQVLEALEEAHQRGIVHRDITPRNVMVTARDAVKVLDFGLARRLARRDLDASRAATVSMDGAADPIGEPDEFFTASEAVIAGTPPYMSPEQADGLPADHRTDLYSTGVLLYELLTGQTPFAGRTAADVARSRAENKPAAPSSIREGVPAALDAFVLKAIARAPEDRHQSAAAMREDLEKILETVSRPPQSDAAPVVSVKTPRRWWPSRRKLIVALAFDLTLAATVFGLWRYFRGRAPEHPRAAARFYQEGLSALRDGTYHRAAKALERATAEAPTFRMAHARRAEAMFELDQTEAAQTELLKALDQRTPVSPLEEAGLEAMRLTLSRNPAAAVAKLEEIAKSAPADERAQRLIDLGRGYERDEQPAKALNSYVEAATLDSRYAAAFLRAGILQGRLGKTADSENSFRRAEELFQALSNTEGLAELFYQRARLAVTARRAADAEPLLQRVTDLARTNGYLFHQVSAGLLTSDVRQLQGRTAEAEQQARESIELARRSGMPGLAVRGSINLGNAFLSRGDYPRAEQAFAEALQGALGAQLTASEAMARLSLASLHTQRDKPALALPEVNQAIAFFERGGYRRQYASALVVKARALQQAGQTEEALHAFEQQLQVATQLGDAGQLSFAHGGIARALLRMERLAESAASFAKAGEINQRAGDKVGYAYSLVNRGFVLCRLGQFDAAAGAAQEALRQVVGLPEMGALTRIHRRLEAEVALGRRQGAMAAAIARQLLAMTDPAQASSLVEVKSILARALAQSGNATQALAAANEAVALATNLEQDAQLAPALLVQASVLLSSRDWARAQAAAQAALEASERARLPETGWRAAAVLASTAKGQGEAEGEKAGARAANELYEKFRTLLGDSEPSYKRIPDLTEAVQYLRVH